MSCCISIKAWFYEPFSPIKRVESRVVGRVREFAKSELKQQKIVQYDKKCELDVVEIRRHGEQTNGQVDRDMET